MTEFSTDIYKIPASAYLKVEAWDFALRWAWVLLLPLVLFSVLAVSDVRFIFLALIWVFIVLPMLLVMVYYYKLLSPEIHKSLLPQNCRCIKGNHIELTYFNEDDEGELSHRDTVIIPWNELSDFGVTGKYFSMKRKGMKIHTLIPIPDKVPFDFFDFL